MLRKTATLLLIGALVLAGGGYLVRRHLAAAEPIKVGILHSLTGAMAASESPVVDATLLAIDEINQAGGILGRPVRPVVVDGRSDADTFAREAERGSAGSGKTASSTSGGPRRSRSAPSLVYRSREDWLAYLDGLYRGWGGAWASRGG